MSASRLEGYEVAESPAVREVSSRTAVTLYSGVPVAPSRCELVTVFKKTRLVWKVAKS
jgi:hypothetical protein